MSKIRDVALRELRNQAATVLRRVEGGERVRVTVNGRPVAELNPLARRAGGITANEAPPSHTARPSQPLNPRGVSRAAALRVVGMGPIQREDGGAEGVAHAQRSRCDEVRGNLALAHIQLRRADAPGVVRAQQALIQAQELIDETGAQAFQPEVHECRAHLARLRGDALAARHEIDEARRLYATMGATAQVERLAKVVYPR